MFFHFEEGLGRLACDHSQPLAPWWLPFRCRFLSKIVIRPRSTLANKATFRPTGQEQEAWNPSLALQDNLEPSAGPSAVVTAVAGIAPPSETVEKGKILCLDEQFCTLQTAYDTLARDRTSFREAKVPKPGRDVAEDLHLLLLDVNSLLDCFDGPATFLEGSET